MALMSDEDEVHENNHEIINAASAVLYSFT
jgi:hypothetical protein